MSGIGLSSNMPFNSFDYDVSNMDINSQNYLRYKEITNQRDRIDSNQPKQNAIGNLNNNHNKLKGESENCIALS